jgi:phage shock protein A
MTPDKVFQKIRRLIRRNLALLLAQDYDADLDEIEGLICKAEVKLEQARAAVASALVDEKDLEREMLAAVALVHEWDARAGNALRAGQEAQARHAVERKVVYERTVSELKAELDRQNEAIAYLRSRAHELRIRLDAARRWRDIIETRRQRQDTEEQIRRAFGRDSVVRDLDQALEQAITHSEQRDAILEAARELESSSLQASLDRARLETEVEAELSALRARLEENSDHADRSDRA